MLLDSLREEINCIDKDISRLFEKRLQIVLKIAKIKLDTDMKICDSAREEIVLEKVKNNVNEFSRHYVDMLYKKIFEISKECQENERKKYGR